MINRKRKSRTVQNKRTRTGKWRSESDGCREKLEAPKITSATNTGNKKDRKADRGMDKREWCGLNTRSQISSKKDFSDLKTDDKTRETSYSTTWHYYNYVGTGAKNPVYYYRVRAIGADGAYSSWSEVVSRAVE